MRFLVGNKCDLEHRRAVSYEQGKELARLYNIQFIETSAKDTINIEELFVNTTRTFIDKQLVGVTSSNKKDIKTLKGKNIDFTEGQDGTPGGAKKESGCCK